MVYNIFKDKVAVLFYICIFFTFFSCSDNKKSNISNTFYIEIKNFSFDSLKLKVAEGVFGKVSFYKDGKLEIISENYVTSNLPELHYFYNVDILKEDIKEGSRKIKIEYVGNFSYDSIKYSLQKFIFKNKKWIKTSDMGAITGYTDLVQPKNKLTDYAEKIVINTVEYSYN